MTSELVLLFNYDKSEDILDKLTEAFDKHSSSSSIDKVPSMIIVSKKTWYLIEGALEPLLSAHYGKKTNGSKSQTKKDSVPSNQIAEEGQKSTKSTPTIPQYDKVNTTEDPQSGFASLSFRSRPIVAIDGDNIVAWRVGANDED
jgi:hypothetical protein